jgi:hypothetical protein
VHERDGRRLETFPDDATESVDSENIHLDLRKWRKVWRSQELEACMDDKERAALAVF